MAQRSTFNVTISASLHHQVNNYPPPQVTLYLNVAMSLLSDAQNFVINNPQFNDITVNSPPGHTGIDILLEASIPDAAHDSSARDPPPRCFPGTREQHVQDIINWALPAVGDNPLPIYWMKGPAGVGKSAVAQTCAEELKERKKLGAAFFFSVNRWSNTDNALIKTRDEQYKFFTSIAYQLSSVYPEYRNPLDTKIRLDRSLVGKTMASQFRELIAEPLKELEEKGVGIGKRVPVIVDGLDECESQEAQRDIVEIVAAAARDGIVPLCWAFFSRPEPHIEATFSKATISPLSHMTILPISRDADGDIELYLKAGFEDILRRLNITMTSPWPSESDLNRLVNAAHGLFIYAKTVLRFVGQGDSLNPDELLQAIIAVILNRDRSGSVGESATFAELDEFYMLIMQRIPAKMLPTIRRVFAALCQTTFSSAILVANFLGLSRLELEAACNQVGAVVHFEPQQEPLERDPAINTNKSFLHLNLRLPKRATDIILNSLGGYISFYHKSFKDFLLDPARSGIYCVNTITGDIDKRGYNLSSQVHNRYCWQGSELMRAPGAPDSTSSLSYPYTNELINSLVESLTIFIHVDNGRLEWADYDFRKDLYIQAAILHTLPPDQHTLYIELYNCKGFRTYIHKTILEWVQPDEFPKFDVADFKKNIRQKKGYIRPYRPIPRLLNKPRGRVESGLYTLGHGSKSIFWYWEIDHDSKTYRVFKTIDLADGERVYREHFDLEVDDSKGHGEHWSDLVAAGRFALKPLMSKILRR